MQSPRDKAPGLLAYGDHHLGAHHAPDLFHGQPELSKAVWALLATKERAAPKTTTAAQERLAQIQARLESASDQPEQRGPGRPPKAPRSLEQAQQAFAAASREHERLAQPREQGKQSIQAMGQAYHFVDVRREAQ